MMTTQRPRWIVEFYTDVRGKSAVVNFINELPARERAKARKAPRQEIAAAERRMASFWRQSDERQHPV